MTGQNGFTDALRQVFDEVQDIPASQLNSVTGADIVFLQTQDKGISKETLLHLKSTGAFIVNWTGDARDQTPPYCFDYAQVVDLTCFSNMRDVAFMRDMGYKAEFFQIGYDPAIYYPDAAVEKDIDIVFMGNNYGHFPLSSLRIEMVRELKRVYGDRFKAYGIGQPDGNFMGNQQGEADIYRRAKIGINLSHYNYERYTSDRMFRMLGSGIAVLSHGYTSIYDDFNTHEIGVWLNFNDLKEKIDHYLANEPARKMVADLGCWKATYVFTFLEMAKNIRSLWEDRK